MGRRTWDLATPPLAALLLLLGLLSAAAWPPAAGAPARTTTAAPGAQPAAAYTPATRAVFSRPGQRKITALVTKNLRHAHPRSTVRVVMWRFTSRPLARELVAASRRGVRVHVLVGGISCREAAYRLLRKRLGSSSGSSASCSYRSARGGRTFAGEETGLHQKSWTFTRSGTGRWIVVVTSANATPMADAFQYNDAFQVVGNRALHDRFRDVFAQQRRDRPLARPFRSHRAGSVTAQFSPWNNAAMPDPVLSRIRAISTRDAIIRIAKSNWQHARGVAIARALARKLRAGARVRVLTSRPFSGEVRRLLVGAGARIETAYFSPRRYHHLKFMTAEYDGAAGRQTRVWTGSENWWGPSRGHDELVIGLADATARRAYVRFFDDVWDDR